MNHNHLKRKVKFEAYQLVLWQIALILGIAFVVTLWRGAIHGASVLAGGMSYCLPNLVFVWLVFNHVGAQQMPQFMAAFCFGEVIKLILSAILFLLVVKYLPVSLLSVLTGFVSAIIIFWIVCMRHFSKQAFSGVRQ